MSNKDMIMLQIRSLQQQVEAYSASTPREVLQREVAALQLEVLRLQLNNL